MMMMSKEVSATCHSSGAAPADQELDAPLQCSQGDHDAGNDHQHEPGDAVRQLLARDECLMDQVLTQGADEEYGDESDCDPGHMPHGHTTIITGFSISDLNAPRSWAPSAPSTARWSVESVADMIQAASIFPFHRAV